MGTTATMVLQEPFERTDDAATIEALKQPSATEPSEVPSGIRVAATLTNRVPCIKVSAH